VVDHQAGLHYSGATCETVNLIEGGVIWPGISDLLHLSQFGICLRQRLLMPGCWFCLDYQQQYDIILILVLSSACYLHMALVYVWALLQTVGSKSCVNE
jgi:hypothetical protein